MKVQSKSGHKGSRISLTWVLLIVTALAAGCSATSAEIETIKSADERMSAGGLASDSARADLQAAYDSALRRYEAAPDRFSKADAEYIVSHAHFGLAMTRIWGLLAKGVEILDAGAFFQTAFGLEDAGTGPNCSILTELGDVELVLQTMLETSVDPIVESLDIVSAYPNFVLTIKSAPFPFPMFGKRSVLDLSGAYGNAEIFGLLGVFRLASGVASWLFAYEDLVSTLASFALVNFEPIDGNPAKYFNSNPCVGYEKGNPLLSARFGILRVDSITKLESSRSKLSTGIANLQSAIKAMIAQGESQNGRILSVDCSGAYQVGCGWGQQLVHSPGSSDSRVASFDNQQISQSVSLLQSFVDNFTKDIRLESVSAILGKIRGSIASGTIVDTREILISLVPQLQNDTTAEVLDWIGSVRFPSLDSLDLPGLDLGAIFTAPPGDLKQLLPIWYSANEPNEEGSTSGRTFSDPVLRGDKAATASDGVDGKGDYRSEYKDVNCDGWWNARGDLIMQREVDAFRDANVNGLPDGDEATAQGLKVGRKLFSGQVGVVGSFLDLNADGVPDRSYDNAAASTGRGSLDCGQGKYKVGVPGSSGDSLDGPVTEAVMATGLPFGIPVTDFSKVVKPQFGWIDTGKTNDTFLPLGLWLGHYWPARNPGDTDLSSAHRDPANGVYDEHYFFFTDPSLGGVLLGTSTGNSFSRERWGNQDLNKLVSDFESLMNVFQ